MCGERVCAHHIHLATQSPALEIKVYAECAVTQMDQQMVRTYLETQTVGRRCTNSTPLYEAFSTSLLTTLTNLDGHPLHCFRSIVCEPSCHPDTSVRLSAQHIRARNVFMRRDPSNIRLIVETVEDTEAHVPEVLRPHFIQKENGMTYVPLHDSTTSTSMVIEVFQCWQASTFASLEYASICHPEHKPTFGIRVSAIPTVQTAQTPSSLLAVTEQVVHFLDHLVYG